MQNPKIVFVSGGVISGLGKGITTASLGLLLKSSGFRVSVMKADMYLNIDAGTMNPLEHGEVFVTKDGLETDQDLGHYERFLDIELSRYNYLTMGQVYQDVLTRERSLGYCGKCVEGHIHIPEEIISKINTAIEKSDCEIMFCEVGGTVGEYQNMMFFESIRRLKQRNPEDIALVHVVYLPIPSFLGEMKSKPAQASVYELYRLGLQPDFVVCRAEQEVDEKRKKAISFNTGIREDHIISAPDVDTIYKVPKVLEAQEMHIKLLEDLGIKIPNHTNASFSLSEKPVAATSHVANCISTNLTPWNHLILSIEKSKKEVKIAIAGKYFTSGNFSLEDSYVCVIEAVKHACWKLGFKPVIQWFDVEKVVVEDLKKFDGIIVPQGWGSRGVEGKIKVVQFARENKIPYLGLCFGMQMAVIEFARNVMGLGKANSEEVDSKTPYPVIHVMPNQKEYLAKNQYGGTIRLGQWPCEVKPGTLLYSSYSCSCDPRGRQLDTSLTILERHRHRYEFNNEYREQLTKAGLVISGLSPDGKLVEAVELSKDVHPFFVGTQFHPEYKSTPLHPHPIFLGFIRAAAVIPAKAGIQN